MPDKRLRRDRKIVLTDQDVKFAENLPKAPVFQRMEIDRRADKNKRIGKAGR